jgi:hypothetical protein
MESVFTSLSSDQLVFPFLVDEELYPGVSANNNQLWAEKSKDNFLLAKMLNG